MNTQINMRDIINEAIKKTMLEIKKEKDLATRKLKLYSDIEYSFRNHLRKALGQEYEVPYEHSLVNTKWRGFSIHKSGFRFDIEYKIILNSNRDYEFNSYSLRNIELVRIKEYNLRKIATILRV